MIRTLIAHTSEIDDIELAAQEIRDQLQPQEHLRKNSVGIISCHYEFVSSGALKAICEALPFDVAGTITTTQAVNDTSGTLLLTLMVLTSDDVSFKTARTSSLLNEPAKAIERAYREAAASIPENPALVFMFAAFMIENFGDSYVDAVTKISGGAPCFGTLAIDDSADFHDSYMIYDGEAYRDCLALILVYGPLAPKFYIATFSEDKLIDKAALITAAENHILKGVNGRPLMEYFESLGLAKASETGYAMTSLPFMLDYGDGTPPISRVFIGLNEDKHAICAGIMPEGATLYLGIFDKEDVLLTTREAVKEALQAAEGASGVLIYSCIARNMSLSGSVLAEADLVRREIGATLPFMMAYSGGEICPTQITKDSAINRFHNNAFILCLF